MSAEPPRRVRLALLFGGRSPEHDVSLTSARSVRRALDPARFDVVPLAIDREGRWMEIGASQALLAEESSAEWASGAAGDLVPAPDLGSVVDVVFPMLHGPFGEDGTIQGLLELLNIPYVGAGVAASAVGMDKALMKALFLQHGLPVLPHTVVTAHRWATAPEAIVREVLDRFTLPVFVKPANMGSSVGISRVDAPDDLATALDVALRYDLKALVEHGVPGYREIECAVLGNDEPVVSLPGEIVLSGGFYDYETKYTDGRAGLVIPARVRQETARALQDLSLRAFAAIDAAGMARVDFLVAPDESAIWLSEINTIPGFTPLSMYPALWQASGLSYPDLISRLVDLALERHEARARLQRQRGPREATE
jgi:D-alanine-D-alanine ligase